MNNKRKAIATSVALTMAAGTAAAMAMNMNNRSMKANKRNFKKGATRMVRTMSNIVDNVADSMH